MFPIGVVDMTEFAGLSAIVTGGASGIGAAIVAALLDAGASVTVLDRVTDGADPRALAIPADVTDDASIRAAMTQAADAQGGIDIVVNNAGIGAAGTVEDNDDAEWARVLDLNVVGRCGSPGRRCRGCGSPRPRRS